jgi:2-oxo-3-hexenedioate decarboxylase
MTANDTRTDDNRSLEDVLAWAPLALDSAQTGGVAIPQLPAGVSLENAYAIQHALFARRLARGERIDGSKLGFTSEAKMKQMGVSEIIVGQLTDAMRIEDNGSVDLSAFIHPRIEPEIAFRLAQDVDCNDPAVDIETCVDAIAPALEIIDSRYRDFRFNLADVVADNSSAAGFVVGEWRLLDGQIAELPDLTVELAQDDNVLERGRTSDILGHPVHALRALVAIARRHEFALSKGMVILAGAATAARPFTGGVFQARISELGTVSVRGT